MFDWVIDSTNHALTGARKREVFPQVGLLQPHLHPVVLPQGPVRTKKPKHLGSGTIIVPDSLRVDPRRAEYMLPSLDPP